MILQLSWKNIWRNPLRSGVVMGAVVIGIWALMFILSFSVGMVESYINVSIESRTSHLQMHHPQYVDDPEVDLFLEHADVVRDQLLRQAEVAHATPRLIVQGLLASATGSRGALVKAVDPELESVVTKLHNRVQEGEYLDTDKRNAALLSRGMGRRLGIRLDQHLVISFQGVDGEFVSGRFRVVGWYDTGNTQMDDLLAFVRLDDLRRTAGMQEGDFHEMAILLHDIEAAEEAQAVLQAAFPGTLIRNYREISPDLAVYNEQIRTMLGIVIAVIMIGLLFGIINTMLMAVLERQHELGMLMAIGMNRRHVFALILLESLILCLIAAPLGVMLGHITIVGLAQNGIDLTAWASGLKEFGIGAIIRPRLDYLVYAEIVTALVITAMLAGIYPAWKAIRTKPVEALRTI